MGDREIGHLEWRRRLRPRQHSGMTAVALVAAAALCGCSAATHPGVETDDQDKPARRPTEKSAVAAAGAPAGADVEWGETRGSNGVGAAIHATSMQSDFAANRLAPEPAVMPAADPIAYLREAESRAAKLTEYCATFVRQERLGLIPALAREERIASSFKTDPVSVKFAWENPSSEFREALYVAGQDNGRVALLRRKGLLGLRPSIERYDPGLAVTFGKSRNSITDFGLYRMIHRTLRRYANAAQHGGATIRYIGLAVVEGIPVNHFELTYPKDDPFPNKRQDLYIDAASGLPLGTRLWLPNNQLDALYYYLDVRVPPTPLADDVFTIREPARRDKVSKT